METLGFVGSRLKQARSEKGISQSGAAKVFGITKVGYQNYEAGRRNPSIEMLPRLASYFKVSTDYLLGLSDEPRLPTKRDWAMIHALEAAQATAEEKESEPKKE